MKPEFNPGVALARRLNYKLIELRHDTTGEVVAVLKRDGTYHFVPWRGFITRQSAIDMKGSPMKIRIHHIGHQIKGGTRWEDVPTGKHVQGCLLDGGCYCVLMSGVKVV